MARSDRSPVIPIEALFDETGTGPNKSADHRQALVAATVILGVDGKTRNEFLLFGRETLEGIARTGKAEFLPVIRIELDQRSGELEKIIALVRMVKGHDDY